MSSFQKWANLKPTDRIVLPTLFEAERIGHVIEYCLSCGARPEQIVLVESNMTDRRDESMAVAREVMSSLGGVPVTRVQIASQRKLFGKGTPFNALLREQYGIPETETFIGKGAAMYTGVLYLALQGLPDDTRVFFMDTDLVHLKESDPIGNLLKAWEEKPSARLVKLGFLENSGVSGFLNLLPEPWCNLVQVTWPLCGQQGAYLGDLTNMPMPVGYLIEYAIMAYILEVYGVSAFAEQVITVTLREGTIYPQKKYVAMHTGIFHSALGVAEIGGVLTMKTRLAALRDWNADLTTRTRLIGLPQTPDKVEITLNAWIPNVQTAVRKISEFSSEHAIAA